METTNEIFITIIGTPVPWKSHGGYGRRSFKPLWREREFYQEKIREQYKVSILLGSIKADYYFYLPILKSFSFKKKLLAAEGKIRPDKLPDRDNCAKFLSDCLQGIIFKDDGQIVAGSVEKLYHESPRTYIRITCV